MLYLIKIKTKNTTKLIFLPGPAPSSSTVGVETLNRIAGICPTYIVV